MEDTEELEVFRQQWRQEVNTGRGASSSSSATNTAATASATAQSSLSSSAQNAKSTRINNDEVTLAPRAPVNFETALGSLRHEGGDDDDEEEEEDEDEDRNEETRAAPGAEAEATQEDGLTEHFQALDLGDDEGIRPAYHEEDEKENEPDDSKPVSAMDHYEAAVKKEMQGSLGDSLRLYRRALKLDADIESAYRKKHFEHLWREQPDKQKQPTQTQHAPVRNAPTRRTPELTVDQLIDSFENCTIEPAEPIDEYTPPAPCPISKMPSEILTEILCHAALVDVGTLPRMSLVCKCLAFHVSREQRIWRTACQSRAFGFGEMQYAFIIDLRGNELRAPPPRYTLFPPRVKSTIPRPLKTWMDVFWLLPRIRFTGVYISTVNYLRQAMHDPTTSVTWNAPIHMITYYRYLRFYPDGTVLVLLTVTEPPQIVRHISKENVEIAKYGVSADKHRHDNVSPVPMANPMPHLASNTLRNARLGRWRLANPDAEMERNYVAQSGTIANIGVPPDDNLFTTSAPLSAGGNGHDPRDVYIELEFNPKYTYYMHLSLRSTHSRSRKMSKNTKLAWQSYWYNNRSLDSWDQFNMGREKPYIFSRVRGWGMDIED